MRQCGTCRNHAYQWRMDGVVDGVSALGVVGVVRCAWGMSTPRMPICIIRGCG